MMAKRGIRGIALMTAVVVAFVLLLWAVAALYRASFQSSSVMFGHRKSQSYYLAKKAISRSVYFMNNDAAWVGAHTGKDNADDYTEGALCWVETADSQLILKCEASVGSQSTELSVPMAASSASDTHVYSISPSVNGGPDLISWTTENTQDWHSLPPIPNAQEIFSVVGTETGDVYAIAGIDGNTVLWRYREGGGWVQMPDLPAGVAISDLSVARSEKLIALGSDNTILMLPIDSSLSWDQISAPTGSDLIDVTLPMTSSERAYAVTSTGSQTTIHQYSFSGETWSQLSAPTAAHFDPTNGVLTSQSGSVPNLDGGIAVNDAGQVFVASNPPGEPSVIYQFRADVPGSTTGTWRTLPPVPAFQWTTDTTVDVSEYCTVLKDLRVDDQGLLWVQHQDPNGPAFSTIQIDPGDR